MARRYPVIFWLLLAATLAMDAVSASWIFRDGMDADSATLFLALAAAQLSTLCVWVVLVPKQIRFGWSLPFIAGAIAAVVLASGEPSSRQGIQWEEVIAFTGIMWIHVALTLPLLWLLKPTKLCAAFADRENRPRWQFSTMHLLVVMTALAILCVLLGKAELLVDEFVAVMTLPIANAMLLVAVIAAVQLKLHWLLRLAASLGGALAIGVVCEWTQIAFADELNFFAYSLIQALVLWAWLEVVRPLPEATSDEANAGVVAEAPSPGAK